MQTYYSKALQSQASCCKYQNFDDAAEAWLRSVTESCKSSTTMNYRMIYESRLAPLLGGKTPESISQDDIRKIIFENPVLEGRKPSANFSRITYRILIRILKYSNADIDYNALTQGLILPVSRRKPIDIFTKQEQKLLISYLLEDLDASKLGIIFVLMTGCRLGEICSLETKDISVFNENVHIYHTVERIRIHPTNGGNAGNKKSSRKTCLVVSTPKTETSDRFVPIQCSLISLLNKYMPASKYLVHGNQVMDPRTYEYRFQKYQKKAGIRPRKFHVLRHTFATNCVEGGMSAKVLSEILGHASVTTTMALYVHPTMDMKKNQLNAAMQAVQIL